MKKIFILLLLVFSFYLICPSSASAQNTFTFIAWGDTKSDINVLKNLSVQIRALNPSFTIYAGDLESAGFTQSGMDAWKNAINGGVNNGLFDRTFPVRGNHDSTNPAGWQGYFNLSAIASQTGSANYTFLDDDLTYSFDHGGSMFIGIDVPGGVTQLSTSQIDWLDQRLTDAETKGMKHAFFFWHGPIYEEANHCCHTPPSALISVINKHPIVSAGFFGHEHILTYTHMNSSRVPGLTREFEQFISGDAGAGITVPTAGKYDYAVNLSGANVGGFVTVETSMISNTFTVRFFKGGSTAVQYAKTFTKGANPTVSVSQSPTPILSGTPTIPPTGKPGDANSDNKVDGLDYVIWLQNYNKSAAGAGKGDFDNNGFVDGLDYTIWLQNYNK